MKKMWTVFALAMIMLASCVSEDLGNAEGQSQGEEVTVKIGFDGEILDITEGPLETKTESDNLWGIEVRHKSNNESYYSQYAYGLFDNENIEIKLLSGYQYLFKVTMIENAKNLIYYSNNEYSLPFIQELKNEIIYSNKFGFSATHPTVSIKKDNYPYSSQYSRYNIIRYYGQISGFSPNPSNKNVNIELYKLIFGVKFILNGFDEGNVDIQIANAPLMTINYPDTEISQIFTFGEYFWNDNEDCVQSQEIPTVSINWTKSNGTTIPVYNGPIKFTRNKQTIVTVNLDQKSESLGTKVEIDLEDTPMTPGDEATINPGDQVPSYN